MNTKKILCISLLIIIPFIIGANSHKLIDKYQRSTTTFRVCNDSEFDVNYILITSNRNFYRFRNIKIGECSDTIKSNYLKNNFQMYIFGEKNKEKYFLTKGSADNFANSTFTNNVTLKLFPDGRTSKEDYKQGWGIAGEFISDK